MNKELIEVDTHIVVLLYCRRKAWQKAVSFFDVPVGDSAILILLDYVLCFSHSSMPTGIKNIRFKEGMKPCLF